MFLGNWEKLEITDKEFLTLYYKKNRILQHQHLRQVKMWKWMSLFFVSSFAVRTYVFTVRTYGISFMQWEVKFETNNIDYVELIKKKVNEKNWNF